MPIKAVIFDCFGVLVTDGWSPFLHRHFHDKPELKAKAKLNNRLVDSGLKGYDDHIKDLSNMTGDSVGEVLKQIENNVANDELFDYIQNSLKGSYKIGILSNAGANWMDRLFAPNQIEMIDEVVLSCDIGIAKPDVKAYESITTRLGVLPEECVFIDDVFLYCSVAESIGMESINYQNYKQTVTKLEEIL